MKHLLNYLKSSHVSGTSLTATIQSVKNVTKRDKTSIQSDCRKLEREITYVNTKINNFCAQLRLQIGKVKKTKSGQATNCINFHGFTGRDCSYLQIRCNLVALEITLTLGKRVEN